MIDLIVFKKPRSIDPDIDPDYVTQGEYMNYMGQRNPIIEMIKDDIDNLVLKDNKKVIPFQSFHKDVHNWVGKWSTF